MNDLNELVLSGWAMLTYIAGVFWSLGWKGVLFGCVLVSVGWSEATR